MPDLFQAGPCPTDVHLTGGGACLALFGSWRPDPSLTVPVAERIRAALMRASEGRVPWQISGKTRAGLPRQGHDHLYVIPVEREPGRGIDRVLLWTRHGLEADTLELLARLGERGGQLAMRGRPRLRVEVLAVGGRAQLDAPWTSRVFGPARDWQSCSSFVSPRFAKRRRGALLDAPQTQLERLLKLVHRREAIEIEALAAPRDGDWSRFEQRRCGTQPGPRRHASGWRLRFAQPLAGPLVLGYGAHYGLGCFEVCR